MYTQLSFYKEYPSIILQDGPERCRPYDRLIVNNLPPRKQIGPLPNQEADRRLYYVVNLRRAWRSENALHSETELCLVFARKRTLFGRHGHPGLGIYGGPVVAQFEM